MMASVFLYAEHGLLGAFVRLPAAAYCIRADKALKLVSWISQQLPEGVSARIIHEAHWK